MLRLFKFYWLLNVKAIRVWAHTVEDNLKLLKHFTYFKHTSVGEMTVLWKWQRGGKIRVFKCSARQWWSLSAGTAQSSWRLLECLKCFVSWRVSEPPLQNDLNVWIISHGCMHASGPHDHFKSLCKYWKSSLANYEMFEESSFQATKMNPPCQAFICKQGAGDLWRNRAQSR